MKKRISLWALLVLAFSLPVATMLLAQQGGAGGNGIAARPEGPCDVYAAAKTPCVAAHSSTRALYAAYNGPLYQVMRQSDGKTLDIGVVRPNTVDGGGYADAAAQDAFCANTYCWITTLYDQSGHGNNLVQAPHGGFSGPAMGGFNNLPVADWAPVTIMGHKVYGVFIAPGMGLRWNDAHHTAVDDQAEGQYWVVDGHHYNGGCCYDYGNAETDSRDDGDGTMETTYFGSATPWYHGPAPGPWIMTDQENNLVGCVTDAPNNKLCADLPIIKWRFVAATADGEAHHWRTMGGDAQKGEMQIMYDGKRVQNNNSSYDPMRKQGAILLGNGGDNSNGSDGTFYEGAMTEGGTFPTQQTNQKLHANIVAARYDVANVTLAPASAVAAPPGLQTFSPGTSQETAVTFTNTSGAPVTGVNLSITVPAGWTAAADNNEPAKTFADPVAPGASVTAVFRVTAGQGAYSGDLVASASWTDGGKVRSQTAIEKARNNSPVKINEFSSNFIELYNAGNSEADISNWSLTEHATQQSIFSSIRIPAGTKLAPRGFYLLGLSNSGLAVPAKKGDTVIYVRNVTDMHVGDTIVIDTGSGIEECKIASLGTAAGNNALLWQPLPDGPVIKIPVGSTNVPYQAAGGGGPGGGGGGQAFNVGDKIGLGYGTDGPAVARTTEQYEVVTITEVGKPGTQTALAANASAGDTSIRLRNIANVSVGDKITLDIDSIGHGTEMVTVKSVGGQAGARAPMDLDDGMTFVAAPAGPGGAANPGGAAPGGRGRGPGGRGPGGGGVVELTAPLKFSHAANIPLSVRGTGITFEPATAFVHASNEPITPLGKGITLERPLNNDHPINAVVSDATVTTTGYQGTPKPDLMFGGPAIAGNAGSMVLRDGAGNVVDSLNYGGIVDPWASEGYQGRSPGNGCSAPGLGGGGGGRGRGAPQPQPTGQPRSVARTTDGVDTGSNCADFTAQNATPGAANQR